MNNKIQTNNQINANIDEYQLEYIQKINMENMQTCINNYSNTSSSRASRGRKFQKKKELYSKERICL